MNPVALYLASGESLYPSTLLLIATALLSLHWRNNWLLRLRNLAAWSALAMILLACAPFLWFVYAAVIILYLCWFLLANLARTPRRLRWIVAGALSTAVLIGALAEWPHRSITLTLAPPNATSCRHRRLHFRRHQRRLSAVA